MVYILFDSWLKVRQICDDQQRKKRIETKRKKQKKRAQKFNSVTVDSYRVLVCDKRVKITKTIGRIVKIIRTTKISKIEDMIQTCTNFPVYI